MEPQTEEEMDIARQLQKSIVFKGITPTLLCQVQLLAMLHQQAYIFPYCPLLCALLHWTESIEDVTNIAANGSMQQWEVASCLHTLETVALGPLG